MHLPSRTQTDMPIVISQDEAITGAGQVAAQWHQYTSGQPQPPGATHVALGQWLALGGGNAAVPPHPAVTALAGMRLAMQATPVVPAPQIFVAPPPAPLRGLVPPPPPAI